MTNHPTDRRPIVTSLAWGILMMCVVGSPGYVSGQTVQVRDGQTVQVRDVENLDGLTRLAWTVQGIFAPEALARVNPLYAYNPRDVVELEVHPDRIGNVATVRECDSDQDFWPLAYRANAEVTMSRSPFRTPWCAEYMSDTLDAFRSAYSDVNQLSNAAAADDPRVYFATTYPLQDVEIKRWFVFVEPTLYAYNPWDLEGLEVHPDRTGGVATVRKCQAVGTVEADTVERNEVSWCAEYMSNILDAFRSAYEANERLPDSTNSDDPDVYFATTHPLSGVEALKRFVVVQPPQ